MGLLSMISMMRITRVSWIGLSLVRLLILNCRILHFIDLLCLVGRLKGMRVIRRIER